MPRAPARTRKQFIDGHSNVIDWELEEALVRGQSIFGPLRILQCRRDWERAWSEWSAVILPKVLEHCPGMRPFALYAVGEIEPRELRMPLPHAHEWTVLPIPHGRGQRVTHYLDVPAPFIESEARYLSRLGIADAAEMRRHQAWMSTRNSACDLSGPDTYPLEMSLYE